MHPEKYLTERDEPRQVKVKDPTPKLGKAWNATYNNVLGEFSMFLLLKLHVTDGQAEGAAAGWDGDQIVLLEQDGSARHAVFATTVWDTEDDSEEFFLTLSRWLSSRFPEAAELRSEKTASGFSLVDGGEYHAIQREGIHVSFIIGLPEELASKLKEN